MFTELKKLKRRIYAQKIHPCQIFSGNTEIQRIYSNVLLVQRNMQIHPDLHSLRALFKQDSGPVSAGDDIAFAADTDIPLIINIGSADL